MESTVVPSVSSRNLPRHHFSPWAVPQKTAVGANPLRPDRPVGTRSSGEFPLTAFTRIGDRRAAVGYISAGDPAVVSIDDYEPWSATTAAARCTGCRCRHGTVGARHGAAARGQTAWWWPASSAATREKGSALGCRRSGAVPGPLQRSAPRWRLLIRPFASKASTAGIFIWEDGRCGERPAIWSFLSALRS